MDVFRFVCWLTLPPSSRIAAKFAAALSQVMFVIITPVSLKYEVAKASTLD